MKDTISVQIVDDGKSESTVDTTEPVLEGILDAVQTRGQAAKEKAGLKPLKV